MGCGRALGSVLGLRGGIRGRCGAGGGWAWASCRILGSGGGWG